MCSTNEKQKRGSRTVDTPAAANMHVAHLKMTISVPKFNNRKLLFVVFETGSFTLSEAVRSVRRHKNVNLCRTGQCAGMHGALRGWL